MNGFLDKLLPLDVAPTASTGVGFNTTIVTLRGGGEARNAVWAHPLRSFNVKYNHRSPEVITNTITPFLMEAQGALKSFRVRDWTDYRATAQQIDEGDNSRWWFRLTRSYGDYTRRILLPDARTVRVAVGGRQLSRNEYRIDALNGIVVLRDTPDDGDAIEWTGEFHVPARFEQDTVTTVLAYHGSGHVPDTGLVEVRRREVINTDALIDLREEM